MERMELVAVVVEQALRVGMPTLEARKMLERVVWVFPTRSPGRLHTTVAAVAAGPTAPTTPALAETAEVAPVDTITGAATLPEQMAPQIRVAAAAVRRVVLEVMAAQESLSSLGRLLHR